MKKLLLIVDVQHDFIHGTLPVPDAEHAMDALTEWLLGDAKNDYESIILTADWHPTSHCSFTENGGEWPSHCVQFSQGASIYGKILDALNDKHYEVLTKGVCEDHEEYSIWKNEESRYKLFKIIDVLGIEEIDICGLAGDICVFNTLKDTLRLLPDVKVKFLKEFSPCIGDGNELNDFIMNSERCVKENNC